MVKRKSIPDKLDKSKSSEILDSNACIETFGNGAYHATPEIEIEAANTESSLPSLDTETPSSPFYYPCPSLEHFSSMSPFFPISSQQTKSPLLSPSYRGSNERISVSPVLTNNFSTSTNHISPSFRTSTPIKSESPPYVPPSFSTPKFDFTPRFAAEMFPENITPRSPARQARLESEARKSQHCGHSQKRVKSLLDQYTLASLDDIYLPNLKRTFDEKQHPCASIFRDTGAEGDVGTKVWDAKVLAMGDRTLRLSRVGKVTYS
jgi:hypothetical protein